MAGLAERPRLIRIDALQPAQAQTRFNTNDEIIAAWHATAAGLGPLTRQKYREQIQKAVQAFGAILLTDVRAIDLRLYLDQYVNVCRHYRDWGAGGDLQCMAGQNLQTCPMLVAGQPCHRLEARTKGTVGKHLDALCHLWRWMEHRGHVTSNVAREVRDQWRAETRHQPRTSGEKRLIRSDDVRRLVRTTRQAHQRFFIILLAKTGARVEELQRLRVDSQHYDRDGRWLRIPRRKGSKRDLANDGKANHYIGIDAELAWYMSRYLPWRETTMAAHGENHDSLLISTWGKPMSGPGSYKTLHDRWLVPALLRAGINAPGVKGPDKVTEHHFRHFFTTVCRDNGADLGWVEVMRGCTPPGSQAAYHHITPERVVRAFEDWSPKLR